MAAWMILTVRTRQRAIVHAGARIVNQADALFTVPGVLLIFLKGMALAPAFGGGNPFGAYAIRWFRLSEQRRIIPHPFDYRCQ